MLIIWSDTHVVLMSAELLDPLVVIFTVRNMTRNTIQKHHENEIEDDY